MKYELKGENIELFKLFKSLDIVESGAEAKLIFADGHVKRNGGVELGRREKIGGGDV